MFRAYTAHTTVLMPVFCAKYEYAFEFSGTTTAAVAICHGHL